MEKRNPGVDDMVSMVKEGDKQEGMPIAEDPHSKSVLEIARKAARSSATILISGETGVGKELIARYIHLHSLVNAGPFISVNCAALPENLIEAMLFGYEKGAFTNALNCYAGKFEQAHNGTLLLDEISEIPVSLQAKLLRVLQEREIERIGGRGLINVNVRVIAATNRNLREQVMAGYFRDDLYYRLNVVPIHCAALRDRPLDILPLVHYFIEKYASSLDKKAPVLSMYAQQKLLNYRWPGNVREMDNIIQRTLIMTNNDIIEAEDIQLMEETLVETTDENNFDRLQSKLKMNEAKIILEALKEADGSRTVAAKKLNMSPRTLRHKISKLKSIGVKIP
jgi:two-component system, response regulator FlrC